MPRTNFGFEFADLESHVSILLISNLESTALQTLEHALNAAKTQYQQSLIAKALQHVEPRLRSSPAWAILCAKLYCVTRDLKGLQALLEIHSENLLAYQAWLALQDEQNPYKALELARGARLSAQGFELGLSWRTEAISLFETQQNGWQEAFQEACQHLTGSSLGRCQIDWGQQLEQSGQHTAARAIWAKALLNLPSDPFYTATIYYNIGISALKNGLIEAEQAFYDMKLASQKLEAKTFKARAWCGLAASRRAVGEHQRAMFGYRNAEKIKSDQDDRRQILRGIGHTQRLLGQHTQALSNLEKASRVSIQDFTSQTSWVYADIAAIHAQLGNTALARECLTRTGDLSHREEDNQRASIVKAEIARLEGLPEQIFQHMNAVNPDRLWAWEEATCFPTLFAIWDEARGNKTKTISAVQNKVHVRLYGTLRVEVNQRPIPLKSNGRAAELLGLLLHHGQNLSTERLVEALFPQDNTLQHRRNQQAIWHIAKTLRHALGWQESIQIQNNQIELDPKCIWQTDVEMPRKPQSRFLDGISSDWVLEVNRKI